MKGFCKILCAGIITTMSVSAFADTYNKEIVLGHKDVWNSEEFGFYGTYYFGEVDDSLGPLAEATHLSPQSYIAAGTSRQKTEQREGRTSINVRQKQGFWGAFFTDGGFYLGGLFYSQNRSYYTTTNDTSYQSNQYKTIAGHIGYYLNDSTDVWLGLEELESTISSNNYKAMILHTGIKHLMTLDDSHLALSAEWYSSVDNSDEDYTKLDTSVTYYPAKNIGLTLGLSDTDYKDNIANPGWDNLEYSFGTEYFITPTLSLDMTMNRTEYSNGVSGRSQQIALTTRF